MSEFYRNMILDSDKRRKERSHVKASLKGGFFVSGNITLCFLPPLYYRRLNDSTVPHQVV